MTTFRLLLAVLIATAPSLFADEITIFDMRKSLAMSEQDPTFRDFYINRGQESGLKPGMIITVTRKLPLYDTYSNRSAGDLKVNVGRVKLIHVQVGLSVARVYGELSRAEMPLLEDNFIMIGDNLELASATMEKRSTKNAETTEEQRQPDREAEPVADKSANIKPVAGFSVEFASKLPEKSSGSVAVPIMQ